jgi:hypothetical protein
MFWQNKLAHSKLYLLKLGLADARELGTGINQTSLTKPKKFKTWHQLSVLHDEASLKKKCAKFIHEHSEEVSQTPGVVITKLLP